VVFEDQDAVAPGGGGEGLGERRNEEVCYRPVAANVG
jgi:hypothetical protein